MGSLSVRALGWQPPAGRAPVSNVSFDAGGGRVLVLLGPRGSGKTTLLRLIAGLEPAISGDVVLDGRSVRQLPPEQRHIGMMFEELALFTHLDVHDNVAFGLRLAGWPKAEREVRVTDLLSAFGLDQRGRAPVGALTSFEARRVALARTLAPVPAALLLDEPLSRLEGERRQQLIDALNSLLPALDAPSVVATSSLPDALALATDLAVFAQGTVLQWGPADEVLSRPCAPEVAEQLGWVTLIDGEVVNGAVLELGVGIMVPESPAWEEKPARVRVMAHPSALLGVPAGQGLGCGVRGPVRSIRPDGPQYVIDMNLAERRVPLRWEWDLRPPPPGAAIEIAVRPGTLRWFPEGTAVPPSAGADPPVTLWQLAAELERDAPEEPLDVPQPAAEPADAGPGARGGTDPALSLTTDDAGASDAALPVEPGIAHEEDAIGEMWPGETAIGETWLGETAHEPDR